MQVDTVNGKGVIDGFDPDIYISKALLKALGCLKPKPGAKVLIVASNGQGLYEILPEPMYRGIFYHAVRWWSARVE